MFKLFVFLCFLQWPSSGFISATETARCDCPVVADLQKTGQTGSSFAYSWSSAYTGAQYKVWYVRREDSYFSGYFYTGSTSFNFTGLSAGHYTFYFQTLCEGETSGFVGIEDMIGA